MRSNVSAQAAPETVSIQTFPVGYDQVSDHNQIIVPTFVQGRPRKLSDQSPDLFCSK